MPKFTLLIFSRNDVEQALELVEDMHDVADEIVLMDASDIELKRKLRGEGVRYKRLRIFDVVALGYSEPLRSYAHQKCTNEWVLRIDTDERITGRFKESIKRIISRSRCDAFAVRVHDIIDGKKVPFFAWQLQLYKKTHITFSGMLHEQPKLDGDVCKLSEPDIYIEHRTELKHTARGGYDLMKRYDRVSYAMFNKEALSNLSKLMAWHGGHPETSRIGRALTSVMLAYERLRLKGQDDELSNFDYFVHFASIHIAYSLIERDLRSLLRTLQISLSHVKEAAKKKRGSDSAKNFEIAKELSEMGLIKFLELDKPEIAEKLAKKYKGRKQGMELLVKLIEEKHSSMKSAVEYENVVISPHIDDAFFSLGGMLSENKDKPQLVVDVFARSRFEIGGKANQIHDLIKTRETEERRNVSRVGADVMFLPFSDTDGDDPTRDRKLIQSVKKSITDQVDKGRRVFFPLGIGSNGGHVIIARIGLEVLRENEGKSIYFYEDMPYAVRSSRLFRIVRSFVGVENRKTFPFINTKKDSDMLEKTYVSFKCGAKEEMRKVYKSQVNPRLLFAMSAYSWMLGCRERIWRIKDFGYLERLIRSR